MRRKLLASSRTSYASGLSALTTDEPDAEEFARAVATEAAAIDAGPVVHLPLTHPGLALPLARAASKLGYGLR